MNRHARLHASVITVLLAFAAQASAEPTWITDDKGCKHFNAVPKPDESVSWSGACIDGLASGEGVQKWSQQGVASGTFSGALVGGKASGKGTMQMSNGDRYEGEYVDGVRSGKGVLHFAKGGHYEGDFANSQRTGRGVMQFANGDRYEGEFVRGKLVGTGTVTWRSGLDPRQLEELLMSRTEGADNLDLPEQARTRPVMKMVRECQPKYPEFAARTEASGVTQVSYLVGKTGKVSKVRVDRSSGDTPAHKLLDFSTTVAVWTCPIEPGKINGQPAEMWATVEYVWTLD